MTARWVIVLVTAAVLVAVPLGVRHGRPPRTTSPPSSSPRGSRPREESPGPGSPRPPAGCSCPTATPSSAWPSCSARTTSCGSGGAPPTTGGSTGSAAPARPTCSARARRWCAGCSSPRPRRSPRSPEIRLPDASDLLPPTLARLMLQGVRPDELSRLPVRRIAGIEAPGLRLIPAEPASTVARVDIWADPASRAAGAGGAVRRGRAPAGAQLDAARAQPGPSRRPSSPTFRPASDITINYEESVDVAAAANAFAPYDLPAIAGRADHPGRRGSRRGRRLRPRPDHGDGAAAARPGRRAAPGPAAGECRRAARPRSAPWPRSGRSGCCSPRGRPSRVRCC